MKWFKHRHRDIEERVEATDAIVEAQDRQHERDKEEAERRLARIEASVRALKAHKTQRGAA